MLLTSKPGPVFPSTQAKCFSFSLLNDEVFHSACSTLCPSLVPESSEVFFSNFLTWSSLLTGQSWLVQHTKALHGSSSWVSKELCPQGLPWVLPSVNSDHLASLPQCVLHTLRAGDILALLTLYSHLTPWGVSWGEHRAGLELSCFPLFPFCLRTWRAFCFPVTWK